MSIHGSGGADDGAFYAMPNLLGIWFEELTNAGIGGMYNAHSHYNIITNIPVIANILRCPRLFISANIEKVPGTSVPGTSKIIT